MKADWHNTLPQAICISVLALAGCSHLGSSTVPTDRCGYSNAVAESWKQQTLLNIVKLRYMDPPVFVDVSQIVSGYTLETSVGINGEIHPRASADNFGGASARGTFTDRPTITYTPQTGEKFLRGFITPIDPKHIFFMLQSGYPADFVLGLTVESLNGVRNRSTSGGVTREADPEFLQALALLRETQAAGVIGMRVEEDKAKVATTVLFFQRDDVPTNMQEKTSEIRRLLRLAPDQQRFVLTYSPMRGGPTELAVNSRSMLQIMNAFASYIDVPQEHLSEFGGSTSVREGNRETRSDEVHIYSGKDKPAAAFTAVQYRNQWFWIREDDWRTKRALASIMLLFTLADAGGNERLPLITIPAQ